MSYDPELYEWLALRRVHDGGMAKSAGNYYDEGRPTPDYLTLMFDYLIRTQLISVAGGDPVWGLRRMSLTDLGKTRYAELCNSRDPLMVPPREQTEDADVMNKPLPYTWVNLEGGMIHAVRDDDFSKANISGGSVQTLCLRELPTAGLQTSDRPWGELCMPCVTDSVKDVEGPGRMGTAM